MAMKYRIIKDNKFHILDYDKSAKPFELRYWVIKKVLEDFGRVIMFVDTNACASAKRPKPDIVFADNGIEFSSFKIKSSKGKILGMITEGFKRKKIEKSEKIFIFEISSEKFTREFFFSGLSHYDIALGIGGSLSVGEMVEEYREDISDIFFDEEFFTEFAYDSILFRRFRATMEVKPFVKGYKE